ncbi:MAG: hypothetical protein H6661_14055 [Ardenticatenaceae bacterium]|nr:hypothetical protein [Ardenticatenaceae bacterium]
MDQKQQRSRGDLALIFLFFMVAGMGLLAAVSTLFLKSPETQTPFYDLAPFFLGLALAGGGAAIMTLVRSYFRIAGVILVITLALWLMGALIFAFGLSAIFYYDDTVDFTMNLGYVVGLCLGPGLLLATIGLLLYAFEAQRGLKQRREETSLAADDATRQRALKRQERAKLEREET